MLGALIIVFREVIEAGIIVGIVLAVTKGVPGSRLMAGLGVLAGIVGAGLVAGFAGALAESLNGVGQELFNASILSLAVCMLAWHNIWMASHGRQLAAEARQLGQEVRSGARSLFALAIVVAVAVMREGAEVALFLYGLVAAGGTSSDDLLLGSALGLAAGVFVSAVTYFGLVTISARRLFAVTTALITFLAAGLGAQAANFFQQAGVAPFLSDTAWDTSAYLSDTSLFGRVLHTLVGYSDQPSVLQVVVYVVILAAIFTLTWAFAPRGGAPSGQAPAAQNG